MKRNKKRLATVFFALLAIGLFAVCATAAQLGDVDFSGEISAADARLALRIAVGLETAEKESKAYTAADADFSGTVEAADARLILRAAVGLEDLSEALPPSALLSEEALLKQAVLNTVVIEYRNERTSVQAVVFGGMLDGNGTVVTTYSAIRGADSFTVHRKGSIRSYRVTAVLAVDKGRDLVLLQTDRTSGGGELNRHSVHESDALYYLADTNWDTGEPTLYKTEVTAAIEGAYYAVAGWIANSTPLFDAYGRLAGVVYTQVTDETGEEYSLVSAVANTDALDRSAPRNPEQYFADEATPKILPAFDSITVQPHATILLPVFVDCAFDVPLKVETNGSVFAWAADRKDNKGNWWVILELNGYCKNQPVTISAADGSGAKAEVMLTVSDEAYVNITGQAFVPDFGAIYGISSTATMYGDGFELYYDCSWVKDYDPEAVITDYADYLLEMGYEYVGVREEYGQNVYTFYLPELSIKLELVDVYQEYDGVVVRWFYQ